MRLLVLHAHATPKQITPVPASCKDGQSVRISLPCDDSSSPIKKFALILRALRTIMHTARARAQNKQRQYRHLVKTDLWCKFHRPATIPSAQIYNMRLICALRARLRALRACEPKTDHASTGVWLRRTFSPNFVALRQFLLPK